MAVTQLQLTEATRIARDFGATRVILFGSAVENPDQARDLDLAVAGVQGWSFFGLGARIERALDMPVDLVALDPPTSFSRHVERWGKILYAAEP